MVHPVSISHPSTHQESSCIRAVAEIVIQVAVRIVFIAISIMTAASVLPLHWRAIAVPVVALSSTLLSGFFFPLRPILQGPYFEDPAPLIHPVITPRLAADAPHGLRNISQNCAFNSLVHFLLSDPQAARALRSFADDASDLPAVLIYLQNHRAPQPFIDGFDRFVQENGALALSPIALLDQWMAMRQDTPPILILKRTFSQFLRSYDVDAREARSQDLREALHRISPSISGSPHVQMDAAEIMTPILDLLGEPHAIKTRRVRAGCNPQDESAGFLTLPLDESEGPITLEDLLHAYQEDPGPPRSKVSFLQAPSALRLQLCRFNYESAAQRPQSWWSRWLPRIFPVFQGVTRKREDKVQVPNILTLPLADGTERRYRLVSAVHHCGASSDCGHYTAVREVNGQKYLINDSRVTLASQQVWDEKVQTAYLLCYTLV